MKGWPALALDTKIGSSVTAIIPVEPTIIEPPTPRPVSARLRLSTIGDCKREIAKLYREVRRGELASTEAGKLVWMLNTLANLIADHDLEDRLSRLESGRD